LRLAETVLEPLFQKLILQGELAHQPLQFLYPVLESPFLGGLVVKPAPAVLPLPRLPVEYLEVMLLQIAEALPSLQRMGYAR
jgi:hypothetical protein